MSTTKKQKKRISNEDYNNLLSQLKKISPSVFSTPQKILAINIHEEISDKLGISKNKARNFLFVYCNSSSYKSHHKSGAKRYHLSGNVNGEVSKQQEESKK